MSFCSHFIYLMLWVIWDVIQFYILEHTTRRKIIFTSHPPISAPSHDSSDVRKSRPTQLQLGLTGLYQSRAWGVSPIPTKQNPKSGSRSRLGRGEGDKDHRVKLTMSWGSFRDIGSCPRRLLCK